MINITDLDDIVKYAKMILPHKCNPRCQIAVGENEYDHCHTLNYLLVNKPPNNTGIGCIPGAIEYVKHFHGSSFLESTPIVAYVHHALGSKEPPPCSKNS